MKLSCLIVLIGLGAALSTTAYAGNVRKDRCKKVQCDDRSAELNQDLAKYYFDSTTKTRKVHTFYDFRKREINRDHCHKKDNCCRYVHGEPGEENGCEQRSQTWKRTYENSRTCEAEDYCCEFQENEINCAKVDKFKSRRKYYERRVNERHCKKSGLREDCCKYEQKGTEDPKCVDAKGPFGRKICDGKLPKSCEELTASLKYKTYESLINYSPEEAEKKNEACEDVQCEDRTKNLVFKTKESLDRCHSVKCDKRENTLPYKTYEDAKSSYDWKKVSENAMKCLGDDDCCFATGDMKACESFDCDHILDDERLVELHRFDRVNDKAVQKRVRPKCEDWRESPSGPAYWDERGDGSGSRL